MLANQYMDIYKKNNLRSILTIIEYCPIGYKLIKNNSILKKKLKSRNPLINVENYYLKSQIVYLKKIS